MSKEKFPKGEGKKIETKEQQEEVVSVGDVLKLVGDVEDNLDQLKGAETLEKKLDNIEDRLEGLDKEQRDMIKEKTGAEWVGHFYHGIAQARNQKGYFFVTEEGKKVFPGFFKKVKDYNGEYFEVKVDGEWQKMDKAGNVIEKEMSDEELIKGLEERLGGVFRGGFNEGLAAVRKEGEWHFIDRKGEDVFNGQRFNLVGDFSEGLAWVNKEGEFWFINKQGEDICHGERFDAARDFSEGLAAVRKEGEWHFIDRKGEGVFNGQRFDWASDFLEGLAAVRKEDEWHFIDRKGEDVFSGQRFDWAGDFHDGFARVVINDKDYKIDKGGNLIEEELAQ